MSLRSSTLRERLLDSLDGGVREIPACVDIPASRATQLATHAWSSVEGTLILSRVLHSPEPFDLAIAQLTAAADTEATAPTHHTQKDTPS